MLSPWKDLLWQLDFAMGQDEKASNDASEGDHQGMWSIHMACGRPWGHQAKWILEKHGAWVTGFALSNSIGMASGFARVRRGARGASGRMRRKGDRSLVLLYVGGASGGSAERRLEGRCGELSTPRELDLRTERRTHLRRDRFGGRPVENSMTCVCGSLLRLPTVSRGLGWSRVDGGDVHSLGDVVRALGGVEGARGLLASSTRAAKCGLKPSVLENG